MTSRNSSSSSLTVHICCLLLLWSPVYSSVFMCFSMCWCLQFPFLYSSSVLFLLLSLNFCSLHIHCLPQHLPLIWIWLFRDLCLFVTGFALSCNLCCIFHALCPCLLKGGKKSSVLFWMSVVSLYCDGLVLGSQAFTKCRLHMNNILCLKDESLDKFSFTNCD